MRSNFIGVGRAGLCLALCLAASAPAAVSAQPKAAETYETDLGPTPVPDGIRSPIIGTGAVLAVLDGQTLKIEGQFSGIDTSATAAHLMRGGGIGIPGSVMSDIGLAPESGKISGSVKLSRDQVTALRAGQIYVQIDSAKSPAPAGHLWGWLLPAHEKVAPGEPQLGRWFLPQGLGLKSPPRGRNS
jgi:hypothetical protein